ncbi:MAG: peptide chain release factor N(5)-glutamine methyltransferase [Ignavibacteria bacterium]
MKLNSHPIINSRLFRVLDLLKDSENSLREKNIENPILNAELLLSDTLNIPRINLYLDFERLLTENEIASCREKTKRRLSGEPLQYILWYAEFFGTKFKVNGDVLIPRPETEILVEKCLNVLSVYKPSSFRILEIGAGSGCISISIAKTLVPNGIAGPKIDAIDVSNQALSVAKENSSTHNVSDSINFLHKDLFKDLTSFEGYNFVISNPPYIASDEFDNLPDEIKLYEPRSALTDDKDGLEYYRKIIELSLNTKSPVMCLLEIGDSKKNKVEVLLQKNNINKYSFYKDLLNIDRVVMFQINS